MTTQLIPIFTADIGNGPVNAIDARVLHIFLEVKSEFRNWIKNRISDYGFTQGIDYIAGNFLPGSDRVDYYCTISMGKELAMVERNAKGKQARQYFIECERRVIDTSSALKIPRSFADALRLYADQVERNEQQQREIEASRPKVAFHDQVVSSETLIDFTEAFSLLQRRTGQRFTRRTFLEFCRRHGIACQPNPHAGIGADRFVPRKDYVGTWFVSEMHPNGVTEWMLRPLAIAGIVQLIEMDRQQALMSPRCLPRRLDDGQEAA